MCGDYCRINKKTKSNPYPIPIPELFDAIQRARVLSTLDLRLWYHQLPLRLGHRVKTTVSEVSDDGKNVFFDWNFLPFGLKDALA